jgi:hypothetical protein
MSIGKDGAMLQVVPTPRAGSQQTAQPVDATILTRFMVKENV